MDPSGGFSLIEMLLTPGVMALLLMAMFLIYPRIRDASAAREAAATIETAKARIRAVAGVRANYARPTQTSANTFLPEGWLYANGGGNPRVGRFPNPNNHVLFYLAGVSPPGQASGDPAKKTRIHALPTRATSRDGPWCSPPGDRLPQSKS